MATTSQSTEDYIKLRERNATLETELRLVREQLAAANAGSAHIISLMALQATRAPTEQDSVTEKELRRVVGENTVLKERLAIVSGGRMVLLENGHMTAPNTFFDSPLATDITSVSLLENDKDLQRFNQNASTRHWADGVNSKLTERDNDLIDDESKLLEAFCNAQPDEAPVPTPEYSDDDLFDFGESSVRKSSALGPEADIDRRHLAARPAPPRTSSVALRGPRRQVQTLPTRGEQAERNFRTLHGAATFIEDETEDLDEDELVAYWERYAKVKPDKYPGYAWRGHYEKEVRPRYLRQQMLLAQERAGMQTVAHNQPATNVESALHQDRMKCDFPQHTDTWNDSSSNARTKMSAHQGSHLRATGMANIGEGTVQCAFGKSHRSTSSGPDGESDGGRFEDNLDLFIAGPTMSADPAIPEPKLDQEDTHIQSEDISLTSKDYGYDHSNLATGNHVATIKSTQQTTLEDQAEIVPPAQGLGASRWAEPRVLPPPHLRRSREVPSLLDSAEQLDASKAFNGGLIRGGVKGKQREQQQYRTSFQDSCETSTEGTVTATRVSMKRFEPRDVTQYEIVRREGSKPDAPVSKPRQARRHSNPEYELFYQQDSTVLNLRRTVIVGGLPTNTTLLSIVDMVHEGPLFKTRYLDTSQMKTLPQLGNTVILEFIDSNDALAFTTRCRAELDYLPDPTSLDGDTITTTLVPTPTRPLPSALQQSLRKDPNSCTRTLFLTDPRCELPVEHVLENIWNWDRLNRISMPIRTGFKEPGHMFLEFASMAAARKALDALSYEFNSMEKGFIVDQALSGRMVQEADASSERIGGLEEAKKMRKAEKHEAAGETREDGSIDGYFETGDTFEAEKVSEPSNNAKLETEGVTKHNVEGGNHAKVDLGCMV